MVKRATPPAASKAPQQKRVKTTNKQTPTRAAKKPVKSRKGKAKEKATPAVDVSEEVDDEEPEDVLENVKGVEDVEWTIDLTKSLVNVIYNNDDIRQGLFPESMGNQSLANGGSAPKAEYHWKLALQVFGTKPEFSGAIDEAERSKKKSDKGPWQLKIKNRLTRLVQLARASAQKMGKTGQGLIHASQVDLSIDSETTRTWLAIREKQPWHFDVWGLVHERPSEADEDVGNSQSKLDLSVLTARKSTSEAASTGEIDEGSNELDAESNEGDGNKMSDVGDADGDGDIEEDENDSEKAASEEEEDTELPERILPLKGASSKASTSKDTPKSTPKQTPVESKKLTGPRPTKSTPASSQSAKQVRKPTLLDKFNQQAMKEEETNQKVIDYKARVVEAQNKLEITKVKVAGDVRKEAIRTHAELERERMDREYALKYAKLGLPYPPRQPTAAPTGRALHDVGGSQHLPDFYASQAFPRPSNFNSYTTTGAGEWSAAVAGSSNLGAPTHPPSGLSEDPNGTNLSLMEELNDPLDEDEFDYY